MPRSSNALTVFREAESRLSALEIRQQRLQGQQEEQLKALKALGFAGPQDATAWLAEAVESIASIDEKLAGKLSAVDEALTRLEGIKK